jgi:hypothetical protein
MLVSQTHRPREQTLVSLGEQLLSFLFRPCRSALIQHLVSGLSGLVPLGLLDWTRFCSQPCLQLAASITSDVKATTSLSTIYVYFRALISNGIFGLK